MQSLLDLQYRIEVEGIGHLSADDLLSVFDLV